MGAVPARAVVVGALLALLPAVLMPLGSPPTAANALACEVTLAADGPDAAMQLQTLLDRASDLTDPAAACDTWTLRLSGTFLLTTQLEYRGTPILELAGTDRSAPAVLTAASHRVLAVLAPASEVALSDLVLRDGRARGSGLDGAGGAVAFEPQDEDLSLLRATRVAFRDNDAAIGGAIAADRVDLVDVELEGNSADAGGALDVFELTAARTTFVANAAPGAPGTGGAVRASGDVTLVNVTFSANRALVGGSVWMAGAASPTLRATFTTFASVVAGTAGAHLHADLTGGGAVALALRGSVLAGVATVAPDDGGPPLDACAGFSAAPAPSGSIDSLATDASCGVGVAVLSTAATFAPLPPAGTAVGTGLTARVHLPAIDGPLIDVVDCDDSWPSTDQRGVTRPQPDAARCDAGAVEVTVTTTPPDLDAPDPDAAPGVLAPANEEPAVPTRVQAGEGPRPRRPWLVIRRWPSER
jgi:hypothetical protein